MSGVSRITLAGTGIEASRLGYGTAGLLRLGSRSAGLALLHAALDAGITHFDTAPTYGLGRSEALLGKCLRGRRAQVTITTKFGLRSTWLAAVLAPWQPLLRRLVRRSSGLRQSARARGGMLLHSPEYSTAALQRSLHDSLRRLRTDYVDLLLLHELSPACSVPDDLLDALGRLRDSGKIRAYGITTDLAHASVLRKGRPDLCAIVQTQCGLPRVRAAELRQLQRDGALVTHSVLAEALPALRALFEADPPLATRWSQRLQLGVLEPQALPALLLHAALRMNASGIVLLQSSAPAHIARNALAASDISFSRSAPAFIELLGAHFGMGREHLSEIGPRRSAMLGDDPLR